MPVRKRHIGKSVTIAIVIHAIAILLLVLGIQIKDEPASLVGPDAIQARIIENPVPAVDPKPIEQKHKAQELAEQKRRQLEEEQKRMLAEKQRLEEQRKLEEQQQKQAEARRKQEQEEARKLAEQKKREEEEARRQAELKKKQEQEQEQKRLEAERKRQQQLAEEKKRKEEEQRKLAEEKKRKEEEAKRLAEQKKLEEIRKREEAERKAEQERLARALAEEEAQLRAEQARRRASQLNSLRQQYVSAITSRVQQQWRRPLNEDDNGSCVVFVTQTPGGYIQDVKVTNCTAGETFRRSVEAAVLKAEPLPEPPDPELFDREIRFTFDSNG